MQQLSEKDVQTMHVDAPPRQRKKPLRRKITVRLSEGVSDRLDVATDRPGVGKSMFVEAALDHFLQPVASVEAMVHERFNQMHARFDRLEHDMRMMTETAAHHARTQLVMTPPVPEEQQHDATRLAEKRFKRLAEQVDPRVRLSRPVMPDPIERLHPRGDEPTGEATIERLAGGSGAQEIGRNDASEDIDAGRPLRPAVGVGGRTPQAQRRPIYSAHRHEGARNELQDRRAGPRKEEATPNGKSEISTKLSLSNFRLIFSVFLPFAAGYFLSFLFRTINASISPVLASDFGLDAMQTGLLASIYFLVFAAAQIPIGILLDRYGPRRVQGILLVVAAGGASLFGNADSFAELLIGRAMIGLGVAAALMAGLKAIVTWFPKDRTAFVNGGMIMLGSLGAVTATKPTDWLLHLIGWRDLFGLLTVMTGVTAGLIYFVVPRDGESPERSARSVKPLTLRSIFLDTRFLRIAPLSATCIGSSWAMQSLWAGSWLSDVEGFDHQAVVNQLFMMALGISLGALLLGSAADRLRKRGIATEVLLAFSGGLVILAELSIVLRLSLPPILPWSVVSVVGAGTVLSFAIIADYFPVEIAARANGALNLVHFGWAFVIQYGIGLILGHWPTQAGHYPVVAYQAAFGLSIVLQVVALVWFVLPWLRGLDKRRSAALVTPDAGPPDRIEFVLAPAEGRALEEAHESNW